MGIDGKPIRRHLVMTPGIATLLWFGILSLVAILGLITDSIRFMKIDADRRMLSKPKHYPEWYMKTPRWVIKYIWPADPIIPVIVYCELIVGIICVILGPISIALCFFFAFKPLKVLSMCHLWLEAGMRLITAVLFDNIWK